MMKKIYEYEEQLTERQWHEEQGLPWVHPRIVPRWLMWGAAIGLIFSGWFFLH